MREVGGIDGRLVRCMRVSRMGGECRIGKEVETTLC